MGESEFVAEIAEIFGRIGRVFADADDDLFAEFGSGYAPGTLTPDERRTRLIDLLIP